MVNKSYKVRSFIVKAFLGLSQDDADILAIFHDVLYSLGDIIKQRDPELYDEIIRTFADTLSTEKIKIEINRARRTKN